MVHDTATKLEAEKERNGIGVISQKVDKISRYYWIKYFFSFLGSFFRFPSKPFFLPFIIFSFSHCCVLWKLFPRFSHSLSSFCKSKRIMNNPNNLLSFFLLPVESERKGEFIGFSGWERIFHCFLVFKGIREKVISFISGLIKAKKVWWILYSSKQKGKTLCFDTSPFGVIRKSVCCAVRRFKFKIAWKLKENFKFTSKFFTLEHSSIIQLCNHASIQ